MPTPQQMQQRKTERESMQLEYRAPVALEQIADALDFMKVEMMEIKALLNAIARALQSR
jgi:hypothetical protein